MNIMSNVHLIVCLNIIMLKVIMPTNVMLRVIRPTNVMRIKFMPKQISL